MPTTTEKVQALITTLLTCTLLGRAHFKCGAAPAEPCEQALGGDFGIPREFVPLAVLFDPRVDQLRDEAVRRWPDGREIGEP